MGNTALRCGWLLGVLGFIGGAVMLSLDFGYGIRYFGPIPTLILLLGPLTAAQWAFAYADRESKPRFPVRTFMFTVVIFGAFLLLVDW